MYASYNTAFAARNTSRVSLCLKVEATNSESFEMNGRIPRLPPVFVVEEFVVMVCIVVTVATGTVVALGSDIPVGLVLTEATNLLLQFLLLLLLNVTALLNEDA